MRSTALILISKLLTSVGCIALNLGSAAARQSLGKSHPVNKPVQLVWPTLDQ